MKTKLPYALTFLSGLLLGWLAIGWWLWPVAYVGVAYPYELNQADRLRYAQGAVDSFTLTGQADPDWFDQWTPEEVSQALAQVAAQPNRQAAAYSLGMRLGVAVQAKVLQAPTPIPLTVKLAKAQVSEAAPFDWNILLGICGGVVVSILVASGVIFLTRRHSQPKTSQPQSVPRYTELRTAQFVPTRQASHTLAHARLDFGPDKPCDQHFPIENRVEGEPALGEFGVNQVEDQPAWDVWLFDQKALVTVTKVIGPSEEVKTELESRGEFIGWGPILLETPGLKMTGRVLNLYVMQGAPSTQGFTIELTVEAKDED